MDYVAEIYNLSSEFYQNYPTNQYPEILVKSNRPYACLLVNYMDDLFLCIPFRSHISHNYAYHFKNSNRSKRCRSGLDYTKIALIKNDDYIDGDTPAVVDQDEYKETIQNLDRIVREVIQYVDDYKNHINGVKILHEREWERRYGLSTLPYYDHLLLNAKTTE